MKIAIHHRPGSFSDRWIAYCEKKKIPFKTVDAYASNIVEQVSDCDAFMWHHHHADSRDVLFAKPLLFALRQAGKVVFPDFNFGWHFDDKVGQKYLFESVGLPVPKTYVFYTKKEALEWCETATFPKVFKLRGGAGSANVRLAKSAAAAKNLVRQAFGRGFCPVDRWGIAMDLLKKRAWKAAAKNLAGAVFPALTRERFMPRHKGYAYFQDFIPGMEFDMRVVVVGERAFALKRMVRKGDFRASGSGLLMSSRKDIDESCVKSAFRVAHALRGTDAGVSLCFDFIREPDGEPILVESSFGFDVHAYDECPGYWTSDMRWHGGTFIPQEWMVDLVLKMWSEKNG